MERYRVTASFHEDLPQKPTGFQTTPSFVSLAPASSYLRPAAAGIARRVSRCVDDTEISIFDAERYFNDGHDPIERTTTLNGAAERRDLLAHRMGSFVASTVGSSSSTLTASSEASWNSQCGLLSCPPGSASVAMRALPSKEPTKSPSSAARRFFARRCPCSGRKSVDVEDKCSGLDMNTSTTAKSLRLRTGEVGLSSNPGRESAMPDEIKNGFRVEIGRPMLNSGIRFGDSGGFSFPILNPPSLTSAEEPPRESLEVFRPTKETAGDPPGFAYRAILKSPAEDDAASDASSDLFEIESFSTQTTYRRGGDPLDPHEELRRDLEEMPLPPSIAPRFDRASLANFSTSASDFGELRFSAAMGRQKCNGLLSCGNEKAVSVGPNPVRLAPAVRPHQVRRAMSHGVRTK
ncbi:protein PHYTOCHROME KINASE SUBSTRATE [Musa troglodytarum]|uniref:Protein PHYTOCHROME KINASE SUBSTRATE n=1 Tax=Musa troglodytarum TaxID=320322 RepID=A0A9E7GJG5_9LILI|nr:protein PHYTOCHROME KINASE SUBSTRATE [Musa troglodytarum]